MLAKTTASVSIGQLTPQSAAILRGAPLSSGSLQRNDPRDGQLEDKVGQRGRQYIRQITAEARRGLPKRRMCFGGREPGVHQDARDEEEASHEACTGANPSWPLIALFSMIGWMSAPGRSRWRRWLSYATPASNMPGTGKFVGGHRWPPMIIGGHWQMMPLAANHRRLLAGRYILSRHRHPLGATGDRCKPLDVFHVHMVLFDTARRQSPAVFAGPSYLSRLVAEIHWVYWELLETDVEEPSSWLVDRQMGRKSGKWGARME
ncbi:hypothetical protein FB451DRAFT_1360136 [Mycena latifolia]|nr:hypothetical protein FB451DRAFT_1360136 [Mycena latifolia]